MIALNEPQFSQIEFPLNLPRYLPNLSTLEQRCMTEEKALFVKRSKKQMMNNAGITLNLCGSIERSKSYLPNGYFRANETVSLIYA